MKRRTHHTFPLTSSGDNSDSEDIYAGFEIDDLPPTSDSEMISHPSDSEDLGRSPASSPSPAYLAFRSSRAGSGTVSGQDTDDEDEVLPTFSFTNQNSGGNSVLDDFFFVETSDLDASSRPPSSLSHHSDLERPENPMHFIYPSLTLAPVSSETLPLSDGVQEHSVAKELSTQNESLPHMDQTHDIQATIDSSLETIMAEQFSVPPQWNSQQLDTGVIEATEFNQEVPSLTNEHDLPHSEDTEVPLFRQNLSEEDFENHSIVYSQNQRGAKAIPIQFYTSDVEYHSLEASEIAVAQPTTSTKSTHEVVTLSHAKNDSTISKFAFANRSWSRYLFGFVLAIILGGYIVTEYYHYSVRPAHAVISNIRYEDDPNLAVVDLSVYTYKQKQEKRRNRPPGFHVRVLSDDKPWSLEEAPTHLLNVFNQPLVGCVWGGWCKIYVPVLQSRTRYKGSEFICSNSSYFLHVWFANGTRISNSPPEIFSHRKDECKHQDSKAETNTNTDDDNYLDFCKSQFQVLVEDAKAVAYLSQPLTRWISTQWDRFLSTNVDLQNMINAALSYYQWSTDMVKEVIQHWITSPKVTEEPTMIRRAQRNAKKFSEQLSLKLRQAADQIHGTSSTKQKRHPSNEIERRVEALKIAAQNQWSKLSSSDTIYKVDQLMVEVEHTLESLIDPRTSDNIQRKAEQLAKEAEDKLEKIYNSKIMRNINQKVQHRVDRLMTSSTGKKVIREAKLLKKEATWLWRDLQW
ncbi:hypothetical protein BGZ76_006034 [Entomortierella beljakovae]|nr:hypothetical protein BGZ76_006034 [Entomortierella beljakovae]